MYEFEISFKNITVRANTEEEAFEKVKQEVISGNLEIDEIVDATEL